MRRNCAPQSDPAVVIRLDGPGDQRPDSDVDLLAAFDSARRISLLDVAGIEQQISRMLGRAVELVEEGTLMPRVRKSVDAEAVRAF